MWYMWSRSRYYAILHPMRAKFICTVNRARRVILLVWLLSFILAIPIIFGQVGVKQNDEINCLQTKNSSRNGCHVYQSDSSFTSGETLCHSMYRNIRLTRISLRWLTPAHIPCASPDLSQKLPSHSHVPRMCWIPFPFELKPSNQPNRWLDESPTRFSESCHENAPLSTLKADNVVSIPGNAAISFYALASALT